MEKPKVSINIPAFNAEKTIRRTIESVISQTYENIEIVVCDDGSCDQTLSILKEFAERDARIKLLENTVNSGVAYTFNRVAESSVGDYIATMSSDDFCLPDRIEKQVTFMQDNPDIDISGGEIQVDRDGEVKPQDFHPLQLDHESIVKQLHYCTAIHHITMMAKKEVYQKVSYNETFPAAVDYDFMLQALSAGFKFANMRDVLMQYKVHAGAIGTRRRSKQLYGAYVAKQLYKERVKYGKELNSFTTYNQRRHYFDNLFLEISAKQREDNLFNRLLRVLVAPFSGVGRFLICRKVALKLLF